MMKSGRHRKLHIPDNLAIFAAILLLVSSVVGFEANREIYSSGLDVLSSAKADTADTDMTENKTRRLNLGLLLFRRG